MLLFTEELAVNLTISVAETVVLLWSTGYVSGWSFKGLFSVVFATNLALQLFWDLVIYPFCVNPLRHLARVPVPPHLLLKLLSNETTLTGVTGQNKPNAHHNGLPPRPSTSRMDAHNPQRRATPFPRRIPAQLSRRYQPSSLTRHHEHKYLRLREALESACVSGEDFGVWVDFVRGECASDSKKSVDAGVQY